MGIDLCRELLVVDCCFDFFSFIKHISDADITINKTKLSVWLKKIHIILMYHQCLPGGFVIMTCKQ